MFMRNGVQTLKKKHDYFSTSNLYAYNDYETTNYAARHIKYKTFTVLEKFTFLELYFPSILADCKFGIFGRVKTVMILKYFFILNSK